MKEETVNKIKNFLELESCEIFSLDESEQIKEMCVAKLCEVLGIACVYNYKNQMFDIFSKVMAEAVCEKLKIQMRIAGDNLRLVKYNGVNFIEKAKMFLTTEDIEEATLDIFNFVDKNKKFLLN